MSRQFLRLPQASRFGFVLHAPIQVQLPAVMHPTRRWDRELSNGRFYGDAMGTLRQANRTGPNGTHRELDAPHANVLVCPLPRVGLSTGKGHDRASGRKRHCQRLLGRTLRAFPPTLGPLQRPPTMIARNQSSPKTTRRKLPSLWYHRVLAGYDPAALRTSRVVPQQASHGGTGLQPHPEPRKVLPSRPRRAWLTLPAAGREYRARAER